MDKDKMIDMYLKAGFTKAQAELLNDLFLSIIVSTKKFTTDLVKIELAKVSKNMFKSDN